MIKLRVPGKNTEPSRTNQSRNPMDPVVYHIFHNLSHNIFTLFDATL